jgi:phosphatidylinositol alpha-1,6-mannosyltransferase
MLIFFATLDKKQILFTKIIYFYMKILFISRAYPPVIGGIEKQNYDVSKGLAHFNEVQIIANTKGKTALPFFLPYAFTKSFLLLPKIEIILLGDGVLSILGYILKFFTKKPVACIIHGLDVTYTNKLYQILWVKLFLKKVDRLIAVGHETIKQGVLRGIPETKFSFIPNGTQIPNQIERHTKKELKKLINKNVSGPILLTVGRLVKRKGITWFIDSVMPNLSKDIHYIIAGDGKERNTITAAISKNNLQDRVFCLGNVSDKDKELLYSSADIFIQPNIQVEGDMEGFGLVVLEAASYGLPVVASDLEGLKDAITNGKNGLLVKEKDCAGYKQKIEFFLQNERERKEFGLKAREFITENFAWEKIALRYNDILKELLNTKA